jgi:hypothetical protein
MHELNTVLTKKQHIDNRPIFNQAKKKQKGQTYTIDNVKCVALTLTTLFFGSLAINRSVPNYRPNYHMSRIIP